MTFQEASLPLLNILGMTIVHLKKSQSSISKEISKSGLRTDIRTEVLRCYGQEENYFDSIVKISDEIIYG